MVGTHHRFVKTTPKPSATKNNKGELPESPLPCPGLPVVVTAPVAEVVVVADMITLGDNILGVWILVFPDWSVGVERVGSVRSG